MTQPPLKITCKSKNCLNGSPIPDLKNMNPLELQRKCKVIKICNNQFIIFNRHLQFQQCQLHCRLHLKIHQSDGT